MSSIVFTVIFIIFILGLVVGSFLNVLIDRIPRDESILYGRSYCEHCKHKLAWYDLIPLLSFLILRGKCRHCLSHISFYYPFVELITGIFFLLIYNFSSGAGFSFVQQFSNYSLLTLTYYLFITSALIVIFFTDLKYGIIPDKILYPSIIISFLYIILNTKYLILPNLISGVAAFFFFLIIYLITKGRGMGFGDVKLVFFMGIFLGSPKIIYALYLAFLTGAFISLILILCGQKNMKSIIPFGPFLVFSTFIVLFFQEKIMQFFSGIIPTSF